MTKQEAIELIEDTRRCKRCRWLAAGYILRGRWARIDAAILNRAEGIRWGPEPISHD